MTNQTYKYLAIYLILTIFFSFHPNKADGQDTFQEIEESELARLKGMVGDNLYYTDYGLVNNDDLDVRLFPGNYKIIFTDNYIPLKIINPKGKNIIFSMTKHYISFSVSSSGTYKIKTLGSLNGVDKKITGALFREYDPYYKQALLKITERIKNSKDYQTNDSFIFFYYGTYLPPQKNEAVRDINRLVAEHEDTGFYFLSIYNHEIAVQNLSDLNLKMNPISEINQSYIQYKKSIINPTIVLVDKEGESLYWHLGDFINLYEVFNRAINEL